MSNLLFLFIFIPILSFVLLALNILLAPHRPDESKISAYECGFLALPEQTRSTFQIHFMIVALLFLIFDLEILLLFPLAVSLYQVSIFGFSIGIIFFIILTIGFIFFNVFSIIFIITTIRGIINFIFIIFFLSSLSFSDEEFPPLENLS